MPEFIRESTEPYFSQCFTGLVLAIMSVFLALLLRWNIDIGVPSSRCTALAIHLQSQLDELQFRIQAAYCSGESLR